jgi:flagellin-specific chaperone FliS
MNYTVIINGQSYDLPKKTVKVVEEMDKVATIDSVKGIGIRDKFKKLYDFIVSLVGKENATEILGSDKLDEVDLSEVTLTFKKIMDAYEKPLEDYMTEKSQRTLDGIPVSDIVELARVAREMPQRK